AEVAECSCMMSKAFSQGSVAANRAGTMAAYLQVGILPPDKTAGYNEHPPMVSLPPPGVSRMQLKTRNGFRPCSHCRNQYPADTEHFYQKKDGTLSSECRPCFRRRSSKNQKTRHHAGGLNYHLGYIARSARLRARKNQLPYNIDARFLAVLL